ncbi:MAG TPA: hypothetical protein V6C88_12655, partial [Chroococcidiopsis sp.]
MTVSPSLDVTPVDVTPVNITPASPDADGSTPTAPGVTPLLGLSLEELTAWVQAQGQPAYRGKQLHQWIYQQGARSLADVTVFSKQWRSQVADVPIGRSQLHYRAEAPDGSVKYLLRLGDGQIIETVGIPTYNYKPSSGKPLHALERLTVCVSSQVGCPMACDFCATGKGGFIR